MNSQNTERLNQALRILTFLGVLFLAVAKALTPAAPASVPISTQAINRNGIICDTGETNCVEARGGMSIKVYSGAGEPGTATPVFAANGSTGAIYSAGAGVINSLTLSTPLAAANFVAPTGIPTSTPAATATPAVLYGSTPGSRIICSVQNITGSGTVVPGNVPATPQVVYATLGGYAANDPNFLTTSNSAGVVTINTWKAITGAGTTTPAAATTVVAVNVCVVGSP